MDPWSTLDDAWILETLHTVTMTVGPITFVRLSLHGRCFAHVCAIAWCFVAMMGKGRSYEACPFGELVGLKVKTSKKIVNSSH